MIDIKEYTGKGKRHRYYKQSVKYVTDMLIHFDGLPPGELLKKRRPSEAKEIQEYRIEIFSSPTQADCDKIQNSLMKIRKSEDWHIKYPIEKPARIAEAETLEQYMEKDFPKYGSFTNWYFELCFKKYLTDSNAIILWMPEAEDGEMESDNEYIEPYPTVFSSEQVLDYVYDEWYFLLSKDKSIFKIGNRTFEGDIYYYVDKDLIRKFEQTDNKNTYIITDYSHGLTYCPIVEMPGIIFDESTNTCLKKSRLSGIIPMFNEAVREYSDLQAEVVQHMHSTMWAYEPQECNVCHGAGLVPQKDAPSIQCKECKGRGYYPFNPFEHIVQRPAKPGEPSISPPFAGFIQKDTSITTIQDERIKNHRKDGLSAINMQFLMDEPLNESGKSKEVDRSELNNFVHAIAEDIVATFDKCYEIVCDYRYKEIIPDETQRELLLPSIAVPEKYDILSENYLVEELKSLKTAGIDPSVINASLIEYVHKKFNAEPEIADLITNSIALDPFASETEEHILLKLTNDGISETDYVIHCNIKTFVQRAIEENKDFLDLPLKDKKDLMKKYADEQIKENSATKKVLGMVQPTVSESARI